MARSSTSFKKRQKELQRLERQREKAEKRAARKEVKQSGTSSLDDAIDFGASAFDFIPDEDVPNAEEENTETTSDEELAAAQRN